MRNLTPHTVNFFDGENSVELKSEGLVRVSSEIEAVEGTPFSTATFGEVTGLPEEVEGTFLIVSRMVMAACPDRHDLCTPSKLERDAEGRIIGCTTFEVQPGFSPEKQEEEKTTVEWNDKLRSRGRKPRLWVFDGKKAWRVVKSTPGKVLLKKKDFVKDGKWSNTTFRVTVKTGLTLFEVCTPFDGWGEDWDVMAEAVTVLAGKAEEIRLIKAVAKTVEAEGGFHVTDAFGKKHLTGFGKACQKAEETL